MDDSMKAVGEWLPENPRQKSGMFVCSLCKRTAYDPQPNRSKNWTKRCRYAYCPHCGNPMKLDPPRDEPDQNG